MFQFTHPCGCDHHPVGCLPPVQGFNSRTRVGATICLDPAHPLDIVSIHAPVWVRPSYITRIHKMKWFQFTHPCGCDFFAAAPCGKICGFNSRTRVGATLHITLLINKIMFQFTHPCGCDCRGSVSFRLDEVSIHAPVWVRRQFGVVPPQRIWFQFTHPCGCDDLSYNLENNMKSFNSRTRVGATFRTY